MKVINVMLVTTMSFHVVTDASAYTDSEGYLTSDVDRGWVEFKIRNLVFKMNLPDHVADEFLEKDCCYSSKELISYLEEMGWLCN